MRLGAHLSIAKGPEFTMNLLEQIGADCFAFFTRNPQGGAARSITEREAEQWISLRKERGAGPFVGHLPYTVNLGTPKEDLYDFAVRVLGEDLRRCDAFGTDYLVVHPGSHLGEGAGKAMDRICRAIDKAFDGYAGTTRLLLETMAGQGSEVGSPAEISQILDKMGYPGYLGICLDTCHLFAAGHDMATHEGIDHMLAEFPEAFDKAGIQVIHLNDSKFPRGSKKDRHARIGHGEIGLDGIKAVVTHPVLGERAFIIETPVDDYLQYGEEIQTVRSL